MRRSSIVLVACLLASAASAQDRFGAIAYSQETDAHGWSTDNATQGAAEKLALKECATHGPGCVVTTWFRNGCGALAVGPDRAWGADWGVDEAEAEKKALRQCSDVGNHCGVARTVCTE